MREELMRLACSMIVILCALVGVESEALAQESVKVAIQSPQGVLGQPVPVSVTITNPSSEMIFVTGLELRLGDRIVLPEGRSQVTDIQIPAGESSMRTFRLLWSDVIRIRVADPAVPRYLEHPLVFRRSGVHAMSVAVTANTGRLVREGVVERLMLEPIGDPVVIPFEVEIVEPQDRAGREWWRLVRADTALALFLVRGGCSDPDEYPRVKKKVDRFVAAFPEHLVAVALKQKLDAFTTTQKRLSNP